MHNHCVWFIYFFLCPLQLINAILCGCRNYLDGYKTSKCTNGTIISRTHYCRICYVPQNSLRDYPWISEVQYDCPSILGVCQNHSKGNFCCCKGSMCNTWSNLTVISSKPIKVFLSNSEKSIIEAEFLGDTTDYVSMMAVIFAMIMLLSITFLSICLGIKKNGILKSTISRINRKVSQRFTKDALLQAIVTSETVCSESDVISHNGRIDAISSAKVKPISPGRCSIIWLVNVTKENEETLDAIAKVFPKSQFDHFKRELNIYNLKGLQHKNVAKYLGYLECDKESVSEIWLLLDYQCLGSVYDYLGSGNLLSKCELFRIVLGMADGLAFLHDSLPHRGKPALAHRDIKPHNILLDAQLVPKLTDFELAIQFNDVEYAEDLQFQVGTWRYMSPELLESYVSLSCQSFQSIDIYALALVIWELMSRSYWNEQSMNSLSDATYKLAFEKELGRNPSMEQLTNYVGILKKRPEHNPLWLTDQKLGSLWLSINEMWDHDADARISASCFVHRLNGIQWADEGTLSQSTDLNSQIAEAL